MYIDSLIEQLVSSTFGFQIEGLSLCAPSFADDMNLLSLSSKALQEMIFVIGMLVYGDINTTPTRVPWSLSMNRNVYSNAVLGPGLLVMMPFLKIP